MFLVNLKKKILKHASDKGKLYAMKMATSLPPLSQPQYNFPKADTGFKSHRSPRDGHNPKYSGKYAGSRQDFNQHKDTNKSPYGGYTYRPFNKDHRYGGSGGTSSGNNRKY